MNAIERIKAVRWWRSVSGVLQHNANNLRTFITDRVDELDAAWDVRFEEASNRLSSFVTALERDQMGAPTHSTFLKVAEKFRRRELRALLTAHLAAEAVATVQARARPILDALAELDPDDCSSALGAGDLAGFDDFSRALFPERIVSSVGQAVDEAVETRSMEPVDALTAGAGLSRVDDEFRNLLAFDSAAVAYRLEQEISRRTTTIDLRGDRPLVQLPDIDTPIISRSESRASPG